MRILAMSGSLRTASSNTRLVGAVARLAAPEVEVAIYAGLNGLPHFNPDLDTETPPAAVLELRRQIGLCDGLLICSPEYAHGVAGAMKNALDWLVGSLEFAGTPVALINASPSAKHAQAQMRETLTMMAGGRRGRLDRGFAAGQADQRVRNRRRPGDGGATPGGSGRAGRGRRRSSSRLGRTASLFSGQDVGE
jgi:chromate reductase